MCAAGDDAGISGRLWGDVIRSLICFLDINNIICINQYCFRQGLGTQFILTLLHHRSSIDTAEGVHLTYCYNDNLHTILPSLVYDIFSRSQIIVFNLHPFCSWMSSCCQYNYSLWKIIPSRSAIRSSAVWCVWYAPSINEKLPATVCSEMTGTLYFKRTINFLGKGRVFFTQIALKCSPNFYYQLHFQFDAGV